MKQLNKVELSVISYLKKVLIYRRILLLSLLFYPIVMFIFNPEPDSTSGIIFSVLFIVDILANILYIKCKKRYKVIDSILLEDCQITVSMNTYEISEIEYLKLFYHGYKGKVPEFSPIVDVFGSDDGVANKLFIKTTKDTFEANVLFEYESQLTEITNILSHYKSLGVQIEIIYGKKY